jgi:hypothetical protein
MPNSTYPQAETENKKFVAWVEAMSLPGEISDPVSQSDATFQLSIHCLLGLRQELNRPPLESPRKTILYSILFQLNRLREEILRELYLVTYSLTSNLRYRVLDS